MPGRTIAIGDIHGCSQALDALLAAIQPQSTDTIVVVGDYVDRGPDVATAVERLVGLVSQCRLVPLLGNHEVMMLSAEKSRQDYDFWMQNGGQLTLRSYGGQLQRVPMHHWMFFKHCQRYFESDRHFFVHASYDPDVPLGNQVDDTLFWQHIFDEPPAPHFSGKTAIVGHSPQKDGEILDFGHVKIIDTYCYGEQCLTALDVGTGRVWQAWFDGRLKTNGKVFDLGSARTGNHASDASRTPPSPENWLGPQASARGTSSPRATEGNRAWPLEYSGAQFQNLLAQVTPFLCAHLDDLASMRVWGTEGSLEGFADLGGSLPESGVPIQSILKSLFQRYIPWSYCTASPGYLAYIPGGGLPESAVAELIAALTNRFVTVWRTAPGLAQIETTVIRWFCDLVGYPAESGGFLASGGSTATLTAVITARVNRLGHDLTRATAYTSAQAHHAVEKSAFLAGIPRANVRKISVNELWQVDVEHLRRQLAADVAEGFQPFLIVGNAGTTNTGAIDDLRALADLAAGHRAWFHVDGAYGGFFLLTERGRQRMPGINRADSIVLDPHKALFLPYGTGCLLVRRQADLRAAHQFTSDYMPDMSGQDECVDLCALSPELSRSGRGLRVWLPLVLHGAGEFRRLLNEKLDLAEWATTELESLSAEWGGRLEIVARPQLSILAFRLTDPRWSPQEQDQRNERWLETINRDGRIMITGTYLGGRYALRIAVVSFRTHYEQVAAAIEIIRATGPRVLDE